jgi:hypothetical protein
LGLVLWSLPFVALGAAALGLVWWLRGHAGLDASPLDGAPTALTPDELAKVEAERRLIG